MGVGDLASILKVIGTETSTAECGAIVVSNFNQLPAGVAALEADYTRRIKEETIRVLHPLVGKVWQVFPVV